MKTNLLLAFLCFCVGSNVLVQGDNTNVKRDFDLAVTGDKVKMTTKAQDADEKGMLSFDLTTFNNKGVRMNIDYKENDKSAKVKYNLNFDLDIEGLIEFETDDATQGYKMGDTIVSQEDFSTGFVDWSSFTEDVEDGVKLFKFTTASTNAGGADDFKVVIRAYGATGYTRVNETFVDANSIKFDLEVHNYDFQSTTSSLAVAARFKLDATTKTKFIGASSGDGVDEEDNFKGTDVVKFTADGVEATSPSGLFSWVSTATTDTGASVDIVPSSVKDNSDKRVFFTFVGGDYHDASKIIWDPQAGVLNPDDSGLEPWAIGAIAVGSLVAVGAAVLVVSKLGKKEGQLANSAV